MASALTLSAGPAQADDAPIAGTTPVVSSTPEAVVQTTPDEATPPSTTPEATTPEAAASAPPLRVPLSAPPSDFLAPTVSVGAVSRDLGVSRRSGLRVTFSVSEPAHVRADVLIFGDVADRELKMSALPAAGPGDSLAKGTFTRTAAGASAVRLPFNVAARRTLRKFYKLTVRIRIIATDAAGNESTALKRITLTLN